MVAPTFADWLSLATVLLACVGAVIAWRTFRADAKRERVDHAAGLNAWWIVGTSGPQAFEDWWGLEIRNSASTPFFAITVSTENRSTKGVSPKYPRADGSKEMPEIKLAVLPPGACFSRWHQKSAADPYDWVPVSHTRPLDEHPLVFSGNHEVTRIQYCDATGEGWSWSPTTGIVGDPDYARNARAKSSEKKASTRAK